MAIYKYREEKLSSIPSTTFIDEGILERNHLQKALKDNIEIIASDCLVISEEFSEWNDSKRRVDLLAIDKSANIVVIELKRTSTGEHMELQALRYAAMVSTLTFKQAIKIFQDHLIKNNIEGNAENILYEFLEWDDLNDDGFGEDVRIILVSADFSKELTTSVMWLNERGIDITCVRLIAYNDNGEILIDVQQIIPLPEAKSYQVKVREKTEERKVAQKSNRDYTKYMYKNVKYNKRKLVFAVIKNWVEENNPKSLVEFNDAFPSEMHRSGILHEYNDAVKISERHNQSRHFLEYVILFDENNEKYVITNQWGSDTFERFKRRAIELGFDISEW